MMKVTLLSIAALLLAATVQAQTIPTLSQNCTYAWDANLASDNVTQYHLYLKKDGLSMPSVFIPGTTTTISCAAAGVTTAGLWTSNVHAINDVGESEMSNTFEFNLALTKPKPNPPKNHRGQ